MPSTKSLVLPSQAAEIAQLLRRNGFDSAEFAWTEVPSSVDFDLIVSRLTHVPTGYFFEFDLKDGRHFITRSPAPSQARDRLYPGDWDLLWNVYFPEWIALVRREFDTPDPWGQFFSAADLLREGEDQAAGNERFSEPEVREYTHRVELIRVFLLQEVEDGESRQRIESKLDFLVTTLRSQGRRDWFFMAMGVVLSEIVSRGLTSEQVRHVLELLVRGVQQLTGG